MRTRGGLASTGRNVYLVGYPGNEQSTTPDLFATIFAGVKSFKRLAPGRIMAAPGEVPDDPRGWILTHDASTLGGNSGSALIDFDADGQTVLGLHFAGYHERQNWAHGLEKITRELSPCFPRSDDELPRSRAGRWPGAPRRLSGSRNGRGADPAGVLAAAWPPAIHVLAGAIVRDDWPRIVMTWDQFRFRYGGFYLRPDTGLDPHTFLVMALGQANDEACCASWVKS